MDAATLDDEVWGKPWYAGARALVYRKDVFEKVGIKSPPKTWDELTAAAEKIKAKGGGIYPFAANGLSEHYYLPTIWQAGGEIATEDGDTWKAALNSPEGVEAIDFYTSFYKKGFSPKASIGWEEPDAQEAFVNGDVAMLIAGGWTYNSIIDTKKDLKAKTGVALAPAGPSGKDTAFAGGSHLVVFDESKNETTANAFVDFMLEPANLNKFTSQIGFLPGTKCRHRGVRLPRRPGPQAVRRAAARALGRVPAVAAVGRAGGREHLRRPDPERHARQGDAG